jgi:hypothetical protein
VETTKNEAHRIPDSQRNPQQVFLVHGRDLQTRDLLRSFLDKLGLRCVEWEEAVNKTGTTMPSVFQAVEAGMKIPVAVVVLLTPDDQGVTKLRYQHEEDAWEDRVLSGQPRLNVVFEAGRATALFPNSTIFVARGRTRKFSDLAGIHVLRIGRGKTWPSELRCRLIGAGCTVSEHATDWMNVADFETLAGRQLETYRRSGWDFRELLDAEELEDLEKANLHDPLEVAFCLASAVQHKKDVPFWFPRSASNPETTARFLVQFIQNAPLDHERPAYRAARLLELLPALARKEALEVFAREVDANDLAEKVREIVSAIREREVVELVERTTYLTDYVKRDLMNEFRNYTTPRVTLL